MSQRITQPCFIDARTIIVPARGETLWTLAVEYVAGPCKVRLKSAATGRWQCGTETCGPGGTLTGTYDALLASAPIGALIGKIGGSDSDCPPFPPPTPTGAAAPAGAPRVFAVGAFCVIDVKDTESGPLFLAMNNKVSAFKDHHGLLQVIIDIATPS
jgi:hypothetical protein